MGSNFSKIQMLLAHLFLGLDVVGVGAALNAPTAPTSILDGGEHFIEFYILLILTEVGLEKELSVANYICLLVMQNL